MDRFFPKGRLSRMVLVLAACGLVACSSPEEKMAAFYQKATNYLQQGDLAKARLEFQNALQINPNNVPAIYGLAEIAERSNEWQKAYGLLSKVVELDPKHLDAQLKLGRILIAAGQLDKALAISEIVKGLNPERGDVLAYRAAVLFKLDDRQGAVTLANEALTKDASNVDARVVLASERISAGDADGAIKYLDQGLAIDQKNVALQLIKVQALEKLAKLDDSEAVFRKLIGFYPDNSAFREVLAQFFMSHGQIEKAEAEFRAIAAGRPKDAKARLDVVRFVNTVRGAKAAIAELEKLIQSEPDNYEYRFVLAEIYQTEKLSANAEKVYQEIIAKAPDSPQGLQAKGALGAAKLAAGDKAGTNAIINEILAKDGRNEQALLLRAGIAIDDRRLEEAIGDLRTILRDVPSSARANALLAKAHELSGSKDLAEDHYARAFQASKMAAPYGLSYAEFLLKSGKGKQVEGVLKDVLRTSPGNIPAMKMLAQAYLTTGNFAGAQAVADEMGKMEGQGATASQIQGSIFAAKNNFENSVSSFKRAYELSPSDVQPMVALVRTYLRAGKIKDALAFMKSVVATSPNNTDAQLLLAQLYGQAGEKDAAQQAFLEVIQREPKSLAAYQNLFSFYLAEKRYDEADKLVTQGLTAVPNDFGLRLSRAALLEVSGKIDEAIALYETLIKEKPNSDIVVNNLASLLTDYRTDQASLKRASDLAQRLKKSDVPHFKDTLGWANYKVGKYDEAASVFKSAIEKQPDMAILYYHQGMTELAMANKDAARKSLQKALDMAKDQPFPQIDLAKKALQDL